MISVAMTTYNGEKFLQRQLDSIMNQTVKVDEIVVCDDGSTDHTFEILNKYPLKVYKNEKNLGYRLNFKKAVSLCHGDYIFLCDQDDIWEDNKVEMMIQIMEKNRNIHLLTSAFHYIDAKDEWIYKDKMSLYPYKIKMNDLYAVNYKEYFSINYFQGCSMCMDTWLKNIFIQNYDGTIEHDWYLNIVASSYKGMYFLNMPLFQYRLHENNSLGVDYITQTSSEHIQQANLKITRIQNAVHAKRAVQIIETTNKRLYLENKEWFNNFKIFLDKHINYIENKKFFGLLFQNFSSYYHFIKTKKARIMDLLYILK